MAVRVQCTRYISTFGQKMIIWWIFYLPFEGVTELGWAAADADVRHLAVCRPAEQLCGDTIDTVDTLDTRYLLTHVTPH